VSHYTTVRSPVSKFAWLFLIAAAGCDMKASFGTQANTPASAPAAAAAPADPPAAAPVPAAPVVASGDAPVTSMAATQPGVVDAGCSFVADALRGEAGTVYQVSCPADCQDNNYIWGTDTYSGNSAICTAGMHAGLISKTTGGILAVRLETGRPAFRGSVRNGIRSHDANDYNKSFTVYRTAGSPMATPRPVAQVRAPQTIEAGCTFVADAIRGEVGTVHVVSCPSGCSDAYVWGTDTYSGNSGICAAAIHSGLISPAGGTVAVIKDSRRPAFRGSVRNGIRSHDANDYGSSFRLQRP
jgi:hypothetical protein